MNRFYCLTIFSTVFFSAQPGCYKTDILKDSDFNQDTDTGTDSIDDTDSSDLFTIQVSLSKHIGTVAVVEWSLEQKIVSSAHIDFGLSTDYGMAAPVDLKEPKYKTYLLGMKPKKKYHFRIVASDGENTFKSADQVIETGPVSNALPLPSATTPFPKLASRGFILSCFYMSSTVFIIDSDGEYVWWSHPDIDRCSRARMSYDGKHIYTKDVNVYNKEGFLAKTSIEGEVEDITPLPQSHHDFTVLPDETIAMIFFDNINGKCDDIVEIDPDGNRRLVYHLADTLSAPTYTDGCHTNSIHYNADDDTYTVSVLNTNQFLKITRQGELAWVFGGVGSSFEVSTWYRQHGHQMLDNGNILFFNNSDKISSPTVLEYSLDEASYQASRVWNFSIDYSSMILGDVQRLPNGNTLITYATAEKILEVNAKREIIREIGFNETGAYGGGLGYTVWMESLYNPPPT